MAARQDAEVEDKVNVLLVDDQPGNLIVLETVLEDLGQNLTKARSGKEALKCLLENGFAVILMDVQMPEMDGFETAALIRQRDRSRHTPIIFMTAYSRNDIQIARAYSLGAVDFIFKPIVPEILRSKVAVFVELGRSRRQVERLNEDLKQRQRALEEAIQRPRGVLETLAEAVVVVDAGGHVVLRNQVARELGDVADGAGLCRTGGQQRRLLRLDGTPVPPQDLPVRRTLRGERFSDDEVILMQPDGAARRMLVSGSAVHDSDGSVVLGAIVYRDVTELRELAEMAQRRVTELQSVLDNMVDAVFVANIDGCITLANEAGRRLLGPQSLGDIGRTFHEIPRLLYLRRPDGTTIDNEEQPLARALKGESVVEEDELGMDQSCLTVRHHAAVANWCSPIA